MSVVSAVFALALSQTAQAEPVIFTPEATARPSSVSSDRTALDQAERAGRHYRTYNTVGAVGAAAAVGGVGIAAVATSLCDNRGGGLECLGTLLAPLIFISVPGVAVMDVGIAGSLASSRRECSATRRGYGFERDHSCLTADVGWGLYGGQVLFPPLMFGGWVASGIQHGQTQRRTPAMAITPGVGTGSASLTFELKH